MESINNYKKGNLLILLFIIVFFFHLIPISTNAEELYSNTYYVATNGSDQNNGSLSSPWRTIQYAVHNVKPGETIYVREGIYREFISIENVGDIDDGYIAIRAYPGELPTLDGDSLKVTSENRAFFSIKNVQGIIIDGFEMKNLTVDDSSKYPLGILVRGKSSYISLFNNDIHHIANYSSKGNAHGILFYGDRPEAISMIAVKNNKVHDLILGSSESLTLSGNVKDFIIEKNEIFNNNNIGIDIAGFYGACDEENCVDQARDGKIFSNTVFNNTSSTNPAYEGSYSAGGIYADGATNLEIKNNAVYNNDFGIELASENEGQTTSDITVKNNKIIKNFGAGLIIGGASKDNGGATNNVITNNYFFLNDCRQKGYGEITVQWNTKKNEFVNNQAYLLGPSKKFIKLASKKESTNVVSGNELKYVKGTFSACTVIGKSKLLLDNK